MLSIALAGKPNAGKSTFYQAVTMAGVDLGDDHRRVLRSESFRRGLADARWLGK